MVWVHIRLRYACDEMRLSVEFVTVGFQGICRQYCCDWFPVSWLADEATPERGTPIIECWEICQLELRPVLLGSPSTVVTLQFIRLPVTCFMQNWSQLSQVVKSCRDVHVLALYFSGNLLWESIHRLCTERTPFKTLTSGPAKTLE